MNDLEVCDTFTRAHQRNLWAASPNVYNDNNEENMDYIKLHQTIRFDTVRTNSKVSRPKQPNDFGLKKVLKQFSRSNPFKVALAFVLSVAITTYSVFSFVSAIVINADIAQIKTVLEDEARKAANFSSSEIEDEFRLRLTHDMRRLDFVGLFDQNGAHGFGNIGDRIKVPVDGTAHLSSMQFGVAGLSKPVISVARRRKDGTILVLGRSLLEVYHLQAAIRFASLAAILPITLIAIVTGIVLSRSAARRLASIQLAIRQVMQGELHVRLPRRKSSDDINELAGAVNLMLDEIVRLLTQLKSVGDNIAHDLKTPLAVMRARLERGLQSGSPPYFKRPHTRALGDLDKALATIAALLRISELESGLRRRAFANIDLSAVCRDIDDLFGPLAEFKGIKMDLDIPNSHIIFGDGDLLREAIANLIENAIKFTPEGGSIQLECGKNGTLIRVSNTGPGIPEDERENIFKRFYRARNAQGTPGAGLGLSMAARSHRSTAMHSA